MRFDDVPEGPQLRLQLLRLDPEERKWLPTRLTVPVTTNLPVRMALGPMLDVPASDYVYLLVDNVVRVYSMGSAVQVSPSTLPPSPSPSPSYLITRRDIYFMGSAVQVAWFKPVDGLSPTLTLTLTLIWQVAWFRPVDGLSPVLDSLALSGDGRHVVVASSIKAGFA